MKRFFGLALILSALSIPSFAAKSSQNITLAETTTVGNTKLPAGEYKLTWTGTAPDVQVTLEQKNAGKPVTVTAPAKFISEKHDRTQLTTTSNAGANTLEAVQLKDATLTFTSTPASGQ
ncbi:MAG TPA: hypothetical protein VGL22_16720 [Terracidiphilus sp.]|jgi:hypothetical protein